MTTTCREFRKLEVNQVDKSFTIRTEVVVKTKSVLIIICLANLVGAPFLSGRQLTWAGTRNGGTDFASPEFQRLPRHQQDSIAFLERNLSGPRLGVTTIPGTGLLTDELDKRGIGRVLSQFGWHFEYQVIPDGGGPQFVVQFVPLVAGVEYGTLIPSATLAMGIRFQEGFAFGLGPNVLVGGDKGLSTALVMAIGKSVNYGGVSIPLNLVFATNPSGNRVSFVFGYAISRVSK